MDKTIIQVDDCTAQLTGVETSGKDVVDIKVTYSNGGNTLTALVPYRVHYPDRSTFEVRLTETDLRGIAGLFDKDRDCNALKYQESIATATVSFTDGSHSGLVTFGDGGARGTGRSWRLQLQRLTSPAFQKSMALQS